MPEERASRVAPQPFALDIAGQLCRVAERLVEQQEELPLLREQVARQVESVDRSSALLFELVSEIKELRKSVDRNTEALLAGKDTMAAHTSAMKAKGIV